MSWNVWSRPSGRFMVDMVISSNIMKSPSPKCYMTFWDLTIYNDTLNWSDITPICEFITELDFNTDFDLIPNFGGFHRTLQRVRLANRGRLLLQTPGPVPFGTCICSNVKTILSWTCHVYGPFEFRTSLGTSILLKDTNTKMSNAKKKTTDAPWFWQRDYTTTPVPNKRVTRWSTKDKNNTETLSRIPKHNPRWHKVEQKYMSLDNLKAGLNQK